MLETNTSGSQFLARQILHQRRSRGPLIFALLQEQIVYEPTRA